MNESNDDEKWDDSVLMNVFNDAIKSHRLRTSDNHQNRTSCSNKRRKIKNVPTSAPMSDKKEAIMNCGFNFTMGNDEAATTPSFPAEETPTPASFATGMPMRMPSYDSSGTAQELRQVDPMAESLSSMLMAWYQSGYATGRYYALLEQQQQQMQYQQQQYQPQQQPSSTADVSHSGDFEIGKEGKSS